MFAASFAKRRGIFYGWWVVGATAGIVFLTGGTFFYGFSALFNPVIDEFGSSIDLVAGVVFLVCGGGGSARRGGAVAHGGGGGDERRHGAGARAADLRVRLARRPADTGSGAGTDLLSA